MSDPMLCVSKRWEGAGVSGRGWVGGMGWKQSVRSRLQHTGKVSERLVIVIKLLHHPVAGMGGAQCTRRVSITI